LFARGLRKENRYISHHRNENETKQHYDDDTAKPKNKYVLWQSLEERTKKLCANKRQHLSKILSRSSNIDTQMPWDGDMSKKEHLYTSHSKK